MGVGVLVGVRSEGNVSVVSEPCHMYCHMKRAQTVLSRSKTLETYLLLTNFHNSSSQKEAIS